MLGNIREYAKELNERKDRGFDDITEITIEALTAVAVIKAKCNPHDEVIDDEFLSVLDDIIILAMQPKLVKLVFKIAGVYDANHIENLIYDIRERRIEKIHLETKIAATEAYNKFVSKYNKYSERV